MKLIDAHIHLDYYKIIERKRILDSRDAEAFVSVSSHLESCKKNLQLSNDYQEVKPAFGFHPEQALPTEKEFDSLIHWIKQHQDKMVAVGEVGLPYYLRMEQKVSRKQYQQYVEMLEVFIQLAKQWDKPIILHAVYEDASIACDLLEKHSIMKAHFHWFKGEHKTTKRMMENGYYISVTPDVVYKEKIKRLIQEYHVEQVMVETDGPWPFEGPFEGKMTEPFMMKESISMIAKIKDLFEKETEEIVLENTKTFYGI